MNISNPSYLGMYGTRHKRDSHLLLNSLFLACGLVDYPSPPPATVSVCRFLVKAFSLSSLSFT